LEWTVGDGPKNNIGKDAMPRKKIGTIGVFNNQIFPPPKPGHIEATSGESKASTVEYWEVLLTDVYKFSEEIDAYLTRPSSIMSFLSVLTSFSISAALDRSFLFLSASRASSANTVSDSAFFLSRYRRAASTF